MEEEKKQLVIRLLEATLGPDISGKSADTIVQIAIDLLRK